MEERPTEDVLGPLNQVERKPGEAAVEEAQEIARTLVAHGVVVVSGLARGIDTVAHRTTLEEGGKTVAVIGTPLDTCYPRENARLQARIMREHLVVSQFAPGTPIQRKNFPLRNRTMALVSHATVIVEAGETSGSLHQGWEALRLGRPLFLMARLTGDPTLRWPRDMLRYGAVPLDRTRLEAMLEVLPATGLAAGEHAPF